MTDHHQTLREKMLAALPQEAHTAFLRLALDAGINNPEDAAWGDVALAYAASVSAAAATEAASSVKAETRKIPDSIYSSTVRAGADLKAVVGAEVRSAGVEVGGAITAAIQSAAATGAATLKQAAADLPGVAQKQQEAIISEWRAALADAARDEAHGRLASRMAWSWGSVMLSLFTVAALGVGGTLWAVRALHMLAPTGTRTWQISGGVEIEVPPAARGARWVGCGPGAVGKCLVIR